jgi:hypothetical protein
VRFVFPSHTVIVRCVPATISTMYAYQVMAGRIRTALTMAVVCVTLARGQQRDLSFLDVLSEQSRLRPGDVANLEAKLMGDPGDLPARTRLLTHYFHHTATQARLNHIRWVVKYQPGSKLAGSPFVRITPTATETSTRGDYEEVRALWARNVEIHAGDAAVISNAASFLEAEEPARAVELLVRAWRLEGNNLMRRTAAENSYKRLLSRCQSSDKACPDSGWLMQMSSQLEAMSIR